jgi:hypothetical protein
MVSSPVTIPILATVVVSLLKPVVGVVVRAGVDLR